MKFKELLEIATSELKELTTVESPDFRLEQAVLKDTVWEIVVSFLVENTYKKDLFESTNQPIWIYDRVYKKLKISENNVILDGFYMFNDR